jgi:predicted RNA-binding Zn-ribbon protein involved in translation (DUF1610 family)
MTKRPKDFPLEECARTLERVLAHHPGSAFYQKWTCGGCGTRVTATTMNKLALVGHCDDCGFETDIRKTGCNYAVHFAIGGLASVKPEGSA